MSHRLSMHALLCVLILVSLSLSGCLGSREWTYPPPPDMAYLDTVASQPRTGRLVVFPLEDHRGMVVREKYWHAVIPLVWSAVTTYDRPETVPDPSHVDELKFDPPRDFARAVADEIRHANIFSSVTFYDEEEDVSPGDFVLRGRLHSTRWERTISTYMLGPLGTIAWMAGMPMGVLTTSVMMDMKLTVAGDPDFVLWDFVMEFEGQVWDGVYYGLEESVMHYPHAVQESLRPAMIDLVDAMAPGA